MGEEALLRVRNLDKRFGPGCPECKEKTNRNLEKNYCSVCGTVYACQDVSFDLFPGEILGIVGESGSGKSTMMQCLYFDADVSSGEATLNDPELQDENMFQLSSQKKRYIRNHKYGMVYQNPVNGLKMNFSSMGNIAEKLISAGKRNVSEMETTGNQLLESVHIPLFRSKEEPSNFSGGMQQRVQIAKALSNNPPILFLDEVTTGLDLSVQANVLDLIKKIQRESGISMVVVSHDLAVIRMLADRTVVMLNGSIIEQGLTDQILEDPQHAYTQRLVYSLL
ncbi:MULTISPECIES: ATP-binding cassette domain-containing protein [Virgibacillus]|uniref:Putative phosphonates utilization ATP-binding protein PhnK n=1 Tax=Virgibacillus massiliensis TaxID=1462526 RepID=A0A024Q6F7_9BACI|nr:MULTISPECIES: ABC transporter ATP-binding protein [Virgibacillus]EQB38441.1 phosphonate C-P lyase [Virgibacillus sp. CM-4]MYL41147.1 ABC transporter ATP-binding protein [Virgibacillus massiliensis]CDQ38049.1 Putative phosphonates utilization ATP-binding protein PhnK [Virgibacillus massiliensis]